MDANRLWWTVFAVSFIATALAESFRPLRSLPSSTPRRWTSNSVLFAGCFLALICTYQLAGISLAFSVRGSAFGLLNLLRLPVWVRLAGGLLALDLTAYWTHRLMHAAAPFWRLHQVHHSETDLDLASGLRFHPIEALVSHGGRLVTIALVGVSPGAAMVDALMVVGADFITHANLRVPEWLDRPLRLLVVTPSMHRTHHYEEIGLQNTNFSTFFSFWDRLFGTYRGPQPADAEARYGLAELAEGSNLNAGALLLLPFRPPQKPAPAAGSEPSPAR